MTKIKYLLSGLLITSGFCMVEAAPSNSAELTISNYDKNPITVRIEPDDGVEGDASALVVSVPAGGESKVTVTQSEIKNHKFFSTIGTSDETIKIPSLHNRCMGFFIGKDKPSKYDIVFTRTILGALKCTYHEAK